MHQAPGAAGCATQFPTPDSESLGTLPAAFTISTFGLDEDGRPGVVIRIRAVMLGGETAMGNGPNVITLLDRFTLTSAGGGAFMNSPWVNVPTWCRTAEVLFECFAFNGGGSVDMKLESSMDRVEVEGLATKSFTGPLVAQAKLTAGLGRYARVRLTGQGGVAVDAVLSAHLILRTAE